MLDRPKKIHVVIPMSGQGTRYRSAGYTQPKPLIPVSGIPMIARLLENFPESWPITLVLADNHKETELEPYLRSLGRKLNISYVPQHNKGPLVAIEEGLRFVRDHEGVLVSYCDYGMIWDSAQFQRFINQSELDAAVICYRGFHAHYLGPTMYAYCRLENDRVLEIREKSSFTDNRESEYASAGGYYFKSKGLLRDALKKQVELDLQVKGEFYTSLTVEALLRSVTRPIVRVFEVPYFFQWGTPLDLQTFEYWEKTFSSFLRNQNDRLNVGQVLMPMAGLGSRLSDISSLPKPLIEIDGIPMFQRALNSLPRPVKPPVIVTVAKVADLIKSRSDLSVVSLSSTPPGQAFTTMEGLASLDEDQDVFVSACDHAISLNEATWHRIRDEKRWDAVIFTVRGFPGVLRTPKSFSFVETGSGGGDESVFKRVSLKSPTTNSPKDEHLLIGSFWFRTAKTLRTGLQILTNSGLGEPRSEVYLDPVFNELSLLGYKVGVVEVDGYINWGDRDSLSEAIYYSEVFLGRSFRPRVRYPGVV